MSEKDSGGRGREGERKLTETAGEGERKAFVPLDHAAALNLPPSDPCGRFCFFNFLSRIWAPTVSIYAILHDMTFIDSVASFGLHNSETIIPLILF